MGTASAEATNAGGCVGNGVAGSADDQPYEQRYDDRPNSCDCDPSGVIFQHEATLPEIDDLPSARSQPACARMAP